MRPKDLLRQVPLYASVSVDIPGIQRAGESCWNEKLARGDLVLVFSIVLKVKTPKKIPSSIMY